MRALRRTGIALVILVGVLAVAASVAWVRTEPEPLPEGSVSAARLSLGPFAVGSVELEWIDRSRPTAAVGDYPGAPSRSFPVSLWYPEDAPGPHPLAIYSHGFVSSRRGGTYLAEHLASQGYVVVAVDYPLTNIEAPGGPDPGDVVHQPGDVSFLIDRTLSLRGSERPFPGEIDPGRIGAFGLSLGGVTTTLVAFHPEWRDPRVAAAVSIAGVGDVFGPDFYAHADVPFLMIATTTDAIVDYDANARPTPARLRDGGLLTIAGGSHIGFDQVASGFMRVLGNPDAVGCRLGGADPSARLENPFNGMFGTPDQGLLDVPGYPTPCAETPAWVMSAGRQQMLTTLAVRAFFGSRFASGASEREAHLEFLMRTLPAEIPEVTFTAGSRR